MNSTSYDVIDNVDKAYFANCKPDEFIHINLTVDMGNIYKSKSRILFS